MSDALIKRNECSHESLTFSSIGSTYGGTLSCGVVAGVGNITSYIIEWRKDSINGGIVLTSGYNTTDYVNAIHPFTNRCVCGGTLYATIRYIVIDGIKYSPYFREGQYSPDLLSCLGNIVVADKNHGELTGRDAADSHPAEAITYTPYSTITAITVAGAINELTDEKEPVFSKGDLSSGSTALSVSNGTGRLVGSATSTISVSSGYVIPTTTQETNWNTAYANRITSLTTTGNSGAATLSSNTLNIPNYTLSGLGGEPILTKGNLTTDATGLQFDNTRQVIGGAAKLSLASGYGIPTTTQIGNIHAPQSDNQTISSTGTAGNISLSGGGGTLTLNVNDHSNRTALDNVSGVNTGDQTLSGLGGQPQLNGTGFVKASGTTISYDNSSYLNLNGGAMNNTNLVSNLNADLLNGYHSVDFWKKSENLFQVNETSANTLPIVWMSAYNESGNPESYSTVHQLPGINRLQLATGADWSDTKLFIRQFSNNEVSPNGIGWQNWREVWHTGNFNPSNYAPVSGSGNYIWNQNSAVQPANAWINGFFSIGYPQYPLTNGLNIGGGTRINFNEEISWGWGQSGIKGMDNNTLMLGTWNGLAFSGLTINSDQSATFASTIQATTAKLTNLTDGYIPYHISNASGLGNSYSMRTSDGMQIYRDGATLTLQNVSEPSIYKTIFKSDYSLINAFTITQGSTIAFALNNNASNVSIIPANIGKFSVGYATNAFPTSDKLQVNGSGYFNGTVNSTGYLLNGNNLHSSLSSGYLPYWDGTKFTNSYAQQIEDGGIKISSSIPLQLYQTADAQPAIRFKSISDYYNSEYAIGHQLYTSDFAINFYQSNAWFSRFLINSSGQIKIPNLAGTGTSLVGATSDGTLTNVANGTGFFKNDGSGNWSYDNSTYSLSTHNHEISSLLTTGISANQVPISNGSNGINFSGLKTINGNSLFGSGNLTLGGGNVSNTGTPLTNQIPIWTNSTTIKGVSNLTFSTDNSTYHYLDIISPSPGLRLIDSDYTSPISRGTISYSGANGTINLSALYANIGYSYADFSVNGLNLYSLQSAQTSQVLYFNSSTGLVTYGNAPSGGSGMTDPMTTRGDIIYRNSSNVTARLPLGASGTFLQSNGTDLIYGTAPAGSSQWTTDTYGITYGSNIGVGSASQQNIRGYFLSNVASNPVAKFKNTNSSGQGIWVYGGNTVSDSPFFVGNYDESRAIISARGDGQVWLPSIPAGTTANVVYFNTSTGALTYGAASGGGGGSGTVTNFSSGGLSPLFTTSVSNPTTTPALSFSAVSQAQNLVYASPNGSSGVPTFRKVVVGDISASGTPSSSTYLRGDGSWGSPAGATNYWTYSSPNLYPNNATDHVLIGKTTTSYLGFSLDVLGLSVMTGKSSDSGRPTLQIGGYNTGVSSSPINGDGVYGETNDLVYMTAGIHGYSNAGKMAIWGETKATTSNISSIMSVLRLDAIAQTSASAGVGARVVFGLPSTNGSVSYDSGYFDCVSTALGSNPNYNSSAKFVWSLSSINNTPSSKMELSIAGTSTIGAVLKLTPADAAPASPSEGMIYVNTNHNIYCYLNNNWVQLTSV